MLSLTCDLLTSQSLVASQSLNLPIPILPRATRCGLPSGTEFDIDTFLQSDTFTQTPIPTIDSSDGYLVGQYSP